MQVQLCDLIGRDSTAVPYINRNFQTLASVNLLMVDMQVRELEVRIAQPIAKGKQWCALLIPVPSALVRWLVSDVMRVKGGHLPHVARPIVWQLPSRNSLAIQEIGDRNASLRSRIPCVKDGRNILACPPQFQRTCAHQNQNDWLTRSSNGLQQLLLTPR